ncbi:hypothetical protein BDN67DRAFT_754935 [Paxillus ammoniavirescens]|nr:hypothetical protein BDN67DRAFT_754935 [Paxillus ammoniavirescens]
MKLSFVLSYVHCIMTLWSSINHLLHHMAYEVYLSNPTYMRNADRSCGSMMTLRRARPKTQHSEACEFTTYKEACGACFIMQGRRHRGAAAETLFRGLRPTAYGTGASATRRSAWY